MSVGKHLRIETEDYDRKIRTFVPHYATMLKVTGETLALIRDPEPTIADLGIGTGALTEVCLQKKPKARVIGIDMDESMMEEARVRLKDLSSVEYVTGNFLEIDLPRADAFVACVALHHILTPLAKQRFYRQAFKAVTKGGVLLSGDCFPAVEPPLARRHHEAWLEHLQRSYSPSESEGYLQAWSDEDVYFPLDDELSWIREAGFRPEVVWRKDGFAVVAGFKDR